MDIVHHISELIYDHDCVIIPELGGFVSNYQPASIHPVQHQFHPPSKSILFNEALKSNDGLLANHIAMQQKISYESAMEEIREFVVAVKQSLANGQTVDLNNIGRLQSDRNGTIHFEQNTKVNFLKEVYGMSSFVSPAIRRESVRTARVVKPAFTEEQKHQRVTQATTLAFKIAASLALLVMLGIAGFNLFRNNTPELQESGLHSSISEMVNHPVQSNGLEASNDLNDSKNILNSAAPVQESKPGKTFEEPNEENTYLDSESPIQTPDEKTISEPDAVPEPYRKKYHLIAGSFLDVDNTGALIEKYTGNGFEPTTIGPSANGYYRVSIAAYLRKDEALTELEKARQAFDPNIWLLRH